MFSPFSKLPLVGIFGGLTAKSLSISLKIFTKDGGGFYSVWHRKRKPVRLPFAVIRVLANNDDFYFIKWREIKGIENLLGRRINNNTGFPFLPPVFLSTLSYTPRRILPAKAFFQPSSSLGFNLLSCFAVKISMRDLQLFVRHVGVDLGGGDVGVTEEGLDGAEVGAVGQQISWRNNGG